jgi:microcystin-dependent protein
MPSTFSTSLRIELIGPGEQAGVWGTTTNNNLGELVEQAITGRTTLNVTSGNVTLTSLNGVVDEARSAVLAVTGTPGVTRILTIPNVEKSYTVINQTTNIAQVKTASGVAFDCPPSATTVIACDGNNGIQGSGIAPLTSPAFTGTPTAPTAAGGTATTQLATTAFVTTAVAAGIPAGIISMWGGSIGAIPVGWALCDGADGRPDLRDRFIVGAGSTYAIGATGGANTVTLTADQIPSHTHTGSGTTAVTDLAHTHTGSGTTANANISHTHTGSGTTSTVSNDHVHAFSGTTAGVGDHVHPMTRGFGLNNTTANVWQEAVVAYSSNETTLGAGAHSHTYSGNTGGISANHTHTYSFTTTATDPVHSHAFSFTSDGASISMSHSHTFNFTSDATGGGQAHENRPPYFALAYIIKT